MNKINTREIGASKEDLAAGYLINQGYEILKRNWHWSNKGEIDIIAIDPKRFGDKYLVFVEVKYRSASLDMSLAALDQKKITQLKKLAEIYLIKHKLSLSQTPVTFDLIAIHDTQIEHVKNVVR